MNNQRLQLLSLTGGGYRGLFTASVLAALEAQARRPIGRSFELTAGTSIGGLLALAVAFERPMQSVVDLFSQMGPNVFPPAPRAPFRRTLKLLTQQAWRPTFDAGNLRVAVLQLFDKDIKLGDALHPVLIPAVNLTQGQPQVFKTPHHASFLRDRNLSVVDIAMATSAAPTFFAPARLGENLYVDGGLYANSPDLVALHEATHFLRTPVEQVYMLSIGTTTTSYSVVDSPSNRYGLAFWAAGSDPRIANVLISAQQQLALQIVRHALGQRHYRIDAVPSHEQAAHLGLAVASAEASKTLRGLGEKSGTDFLGNVAAPTLLQHNAQDLLSKSGYPNG
jgi:uncharacterized protein